MQWDGVLEDLGCAVGGAPSLYALRGLLLLCVLPRGAFLLCGSVLAGCAWGYLISPVCAKVGVFLRCARGGGGRGYPSSVRLRGELPLCVPRQGCAGRGAPVEPSSVCACECVQREGYCALCVCVCRGEGRRVCCGESRAACVQRGQRFQSVCVQRGEGCAFCVRARLGGWHSQGIRCCVLCLSIRVIRMRTCNFMIL